jgi:hypothetical protein
MLDSLAFLSLSGNAVKLYLYMKMWACGRDSVQYSTSMAQGFMTANTFRRARDELVKKGFITFPNKMSAKYKRESCEFEFSDHWQLYREETDTHKKG